jgi:hypothetical protein
MSRELVGIEGVNGAFVEGVTRGEDAFARVAHLGSAPREAIMYGDDWVGRRMSNSYLTVYRGLQISNVRRLAHMCPEGTTPMSSSRSECPCSLLPLPTQRLLANLHLSYNATILSLHVPCVGSHSKTAPGCITIDFYKHIWYAKYRSTAVRDCALSATRSPPRRSTTL